MRDFFTLTWSGPGMLGTVPFKIYLSPSQIVGANETRYLGVIDVRILGPDTPTFEYLGAEDEVSVNPQHMERDGPLHAAWEITHYSVGQEDEEIAWLDEFFGREAPASGSNQHTEEKSLSCCGKIGAIIKKILKALGPILVVALLIFAAYLLVFASVAGGAAAVAALEGFAGAYLPAMFVGLEATTWGYIALGAAVLIDPETAGEIIGDAVDVVTGVVGDVIGTVVDGVGNGLFGEGGWGKAILYGGLGLLAYFLLTGDDDDGRDKTAVQADDPALLGQPLSQQMATESDGSIAYSGDIETDWGDYDFSADYSLV